MLGKERNQGDSEKGKEPVEVFRGCREKFPIPLQDLGCLRKRPKRRLTDDGINRMQPELQSGNNAKFASASTNRPKELGMVFRPLSF